LIVRQRAAACIDGVAHRSHLHDPEGPTSLAWSLLREEHGASHGRSDGERRDGHDGSRRDERAERDSAIKRSFGQKGQPALSHAAGE
jgi:hypothetical protein